MSDLFSFGLGASTRNTAGDILDTWYPLPLKEPQGAVAEAAQRIGNQDRAGPGEATLAADALEAGGQPIAASAYRMLAELDQPLTAVLLEADEDIASAPQAYLKLHLLSHRLALPNTLNLNGIFEHLPTVAWTSQGPVDPSAVPARLVAARAAGEHLTVYAVDKFPRMTDYVIPSGVRIADSSRVRLGAYVGDGTTVMHEGQINFNAGALGPNMVEGRISQGVVLGSHSDLGGSASTMGTLSGGGEIVISIGEQCLVGANAGCGIPLGDRCTIEAGLYITAGTVVQVLDESSTVVRTVKARDLAGQNDMLFIRHSQTGKVQCRTNRRAIELNVRLHAHN
ncbi:MAG: DapH/DapD/GlmU-related protein [Gammaproteobacteria bacterium]|nr:DapH/DapD/GlmU-related protein [Gammaproteobacteria bacterium]